MDGDVGRHGSAQRVEGAECHLKQEGPCSGTAPMALDADTEMVGTVGKRDAEPSGGRLRPVPIAANVWDG